MLRYLKVTSPDISNGLGCRVTLWVAGCWHRCPGCHGQHTWDHNQGHSRISEIIKTLDKELSRPEIAGLTLSGGDPLTQDAEGLYDVLTIIDWVHTHHPSKNIWLYSGYTYEEIMAKRYVDDPLRHVLRQQIVKKCDVWVDGRFEIDKKDLSLPFRGSSNQRIIDVRQTLKDGEVTLLEIE